MSQIEKIAREFLAYGSYNGREIKLTQQLLEEIERIRKNG